MKTIRMRVSTACVLFTCYNKGVSPLVCVWQRLLAGSGVGKLYTENRGSSELPWGEAGGGLPRSGVSYVIDGFLWLSPRWKWGQN